MNFRYPTYKIATTSCQTLRPFLPLVLVSLLGASSIASAAILCVNPGGTAGCKSSINAAVAAAGSGDTIQVWPGTYHEDVLITKSLSLVALGKTKPIIDAKG